MLSNEQALSSNCNVAINKNEAEAKDWKAGKLVRVVRNCKGRKHSEFCPEEGNRYDGIYKYPEGYLESLEEKQKAASENGSEKKRKNDDINKKFWDECLEVVSICNGQQEFLKKVENTFSCICCQEVVFIPITTICCHNICKSCLNRSFKAGVFSCPMCCQELQKTCINDTNKNLQNVLLCLFPGYDAGRSLKLCASDRR
ncbi:hypothetical protein CEXT_114282 [Caerostris extrusa]|uniref:RING-type domain-containing protein n=1 Tax=Caerostris extrusa TaxID=172846 RepID=A0AAV4PQY6_CAEEX|nr:hypothetical protein CEXT_114282 [Caerostris extrusa]